ncbi:hypothetical protein [Bradyrhizobium sp. LHD-71]|uniref:hypothetical protein n=1 Tax=Bradyrhizobium sp. LHD-71 TaxID=3072141 RepID=UPI00280DC937|nr:hypothetical protein [Bradyrhizobium sp. LHD-71]MDQ8729094.1 hypothetical protein [Bradyrhizobium sp. LHD-71]
MRVVRYQAKPDRADANQQLVEAVFEELRAASPDGLRYLSIRLDDGTFIHVVETADSEKLTTLPAFKAFQSELRDRCAQRPLVCDAAVVGNYRMLGE